ncbi:MAG: hypothetical protein B0A82_23555 [Alkalinema sp. CACIAM 70d]|nr:MAG: hypothetical protein B0A82_23555 [Alkalinema sp. CACIAM 70d]
MQRSLIAYTISKGIILKMEMDSQLGIYRYLGIYNNLKYKILLSEGTAILADKFSLELPQ